MRFEEGPRADSQGPSAEGQGASPQLCSLHLHLHLHLRLGCGEPLRARLSSRAPASPRAAGASGAVGPARRLSAPWRPRPEWRR
ncbi:hypothetical protein [Thiohalocapsa sp.]|jgi:hypothetical protein|uniref:hypothetical protein n=1 Tax=Thiohalocapsa sp. TaxID=2497641 RepID=UPI002600C47E|nr:hypothetical protein [Thiohalocapsa sp.]